MIYSSKQNSSERNNYESHKSITEQLNRRTEYNRDYVTV